MSIIEKFLGAKSKYDKTIPYTYMAKIPAVRKEDGVFLHSFSDTICGLVKYLDEKDIAPDDVELFGVYREKEIKLDLKYCTDEVGNWLVPPELCSSLEQHYKETMEEQYKGHVEKHDCSYIDRTQEVN